MRLHVRTCGPERACLHVSLRTHFLRLKFKKKPSAYKVNYWYLNEINMSLPINCQADQIRNRQGLFAFNPSKWI